MSQMVYLKETTTTEIETKIVEIPDYTDQLKELREKDVVSKLHSKVSQKRIEDTASSPFEQIVVYLSELVRPFLNDETIMSNATYSDYLNKNENCIDVRLNNHDPENSYIVIKLSKRKPNIGWYCDTLAYIYKDKMELIPESIPTDTYNVRNILIGWPDFKKTYLGRLEYITRMKLSNMQYEKEKYEEIIDLIDNFTV